MMSEPVKKTGQTSEPDLEEGGGNAAGTRAPEQGTEAKKLVLTSKFRVTKLDVLRLMPEDAVAFTQYDWQEYEEPPLTGGKTTDFSGGKGVHADREVSETAFVAASTGIKPWYRSDISNLTAKIAELETAIAKTADQWEPDDAGRDSYAGKQPPSMTWQEHVELDATGAPVATQNMPSSSQTVRSVGGESEEGPVLDEEMLQKMVAEIIRDELRGEIGQKITRNVRNLVRREVQRVLASKSLE